MSVSAPALDSRPPAIARLQCWSLLTSFLLAGHPASASSDKARQGALAEQDEAGLVREGYRRYQGVCGHCHGPDGVGSSFASSLIAPLPNFDRFVAAVSGGVTGSRGVMRGFAGDPNVEPYLGAIYAYLAARASGRVG